MPHKDAVERVLQDVLADVVQDTACAQQQPANTALLTATSPDVRAAVLLGQASVAASNQLEGPDNATSAAPEVASQGAPVLASTTAHIDSPPADTAASAVASQPVTLENAVASSTGGQAAASADAPVKALSPRCDDAETGSAAAACPVEAVLAHLVDKTALSAQQAHQDYAEMDSSAGSARQPGPCSFSNHGEQAVSRGGMAACRESEDRNPQATSSHAVELPGSLDSIANGQEGGEGRPQATSSHAEQPSAAPSAAPQDANTEAPSAYASAEAATMSCTAQQDSSGSSYAQQPSAGTSSEPQEAVTNTPPSRAERPGTASSPDAAADGPRTSCAAQQDSDGEADLQNTAVSSRGETLQQDMPGGAGSACSKSSSNDTPHQGRLAAYEHETPDAHLAASSADAQKQEDDVQDEHQTAAQGREDGPHGDSRRSSSHEASSSAAAQDQDIGLGADRSEHMSNEGPSSRLPAQHQNSAPAEPLHTTAFRGDLLASSHDALMDQPATSREAFQHTDQQQQQQQEPSSSAIDSQWENANQREHPPGASTAGAMRHGHHQQHHQPSSASSSLAEATGQREGAHEDEPPSDTIPHCQPAAPCIELDHDTQPAARSEMHPHDQQLLASIDTILDCLVSDIEAGQQQGHKPLHSAATRALVNGLFSPETALLGADPCPEIEAGHNPPHSAATRALVHGLFSPETALLGADMCPEIECSPGEERAAMQLQRRQSSLLALKQHLRRSSGSQTLAPPTHLSPPPGPQPHHAKHPGWHSQQGGSPTRVSAPPGAQSLKTAHHSGLQHPSSDTARVRVNASPLHGQHPKAWEASGQQRTMPQHAHQRLAAQHSEHAHHAQQHHEAQRSAHIRSSSPEADRAGHKASPSAHHHLNNSPPSPARLHSKIPSPTRSTSISPDAAAPATSGLPRPEASSPNMSQNHAPTDAAGKEVPAKSAPEAAAAAASSPTPESSCSASPREGRLRTPSTHAHPHGKLPPVKTPPLIRVPLREAVQGITDATEVSRVLRQRHIALCHEAKQRAARKQALDEMLTQEALHGLLKEHELREVALLRRAAERAQQVETRRQQMAQAAAIRRQAINSIRSEQAAAETARLRAHKPLYQKLEEAYSKRHAEEDAQRRQQLAAHRQQYAPLDMDQIRDHERTLPQKLAQAEAELRQKRRAEAGLLGLTENPEITDAEGLGSAAKAAAKLSPQYYKGRNAARAARELALQRRKADLAAEERAAIRRRQQQYGKVVKALYQPGVDPSKQAETEEHIRYTQPMRPHAMQRYRENMQTSAAAPVMDYMDASVASGHGSRLSEEQHSPSLLPSIASALSQRADSTSARNGQHAQQRQPGQQPDDAVHHPPHSARSTASRQDGGEFRASYRTGAGQDSASIEPLRLPQLPRDSTSSSRTEGAVTGSAVLAVRPGDPWYAKSTSADDPEILAIRQKIRALTHGTAA